MSAMFILIPASLLVASLFLFAYIWNVRDDQFVDKQGAAIRMLHEDEIKPTVKQ